MMSLQSMTSSASRLDGENKPENNQQGGNGASDLLSQETSFQDAIFGVLFTLGKEKYSDSWKVAFANIVLDFIQILLFIVNTQYPWDIPWGNPMLKWVKQVNLRNPLVGFGYSSFSIFFYLLASCLFLSLALCVYVAYNFKTDNFPYVWPIKFLRLFVSVFLDSFYISLLNIYLIGPNCGIRVNPGMSWAFPDVKCFTLPHIFMFIVGIVCATLASIMSFLLVVSSSEGNVRAKSLTASSHSSMEIRLWFGKTVITIVAALVPNYPTALALFFLIMCSYLWWNLLRRAPYYSGLTNCLKFSLYTVLVWCSAMLVILQKDLAANKKGITLTMIGGAPGVFLAAWFLMKFRLWLGHRVASQYYDVPTTMEERLDVWLFDANEVEIASRCCRMTNDAGMWSDDWTDAAEAVLKAGIRKYPNSAFLCLVYGNFLMVVRQKNQAATTQFTRARKCKGITIAERFAIFVADRERKQRTGNEHGGDAMDLVAYVEFQNTYKQLMQNHIASLKTVRGFWKELLKSNVTFASLNKLFGMMDDSDQKAERSYKMLLERYPKSFKLLRSYGRFLEDVKGDPFGASRCFQEADRLEEQETSDVGQISSLEGMDASALMGNRAEAIIVITETGTITFVNSKLLKMFGYKKGELESKNVSCLMPNPFASRHDNFLRNYKLTGKAVGMNKERILVALHKQRYIFPVGLTVTKSVQGDQGTVYVGVFRAIADDVSKASVFLTSAGLMLAANRGFLDMFGFNQNEIQGKNIRFIASQPELMEKELRSILETLDKNESVAKSGTGEADPSPFPAAGAEASPGAEASLGLDPAVNNGVLCSFDALVKHKYGQAPFKVRVSVAMAGSETIRIPVLSMVQAEASQGVVAMNSHGNITYCSASIETMLGYKIGALGRGFVELSRILPSPYANLHQKMVKDWEHYAESTGDTARRAISCSSGRIVSLQAKDGAHVPVKLSMSVTTDPESKKPLYAASIMQVPNTSIWTGDEVQTTQDDLLCSSARLRFLCSKDGTILAADAPAGNSTMSSVLDGSEPPSAPPPFGYFNRDLQGCHLMDVIDVFAEAVAKARIFNADVRPENVVPPLIGAMLERLDDGLLSYRVGVALGDRGTGYAAAFMVVHACDRDSVDMESLMSNGAFVADPEEALELEEFLMIDLYDAEKLQGTVDIDKSDGTVRRCDRQAAILLGHQQDVIQGRLINELIASPISINKISSSLGLRLGKDIGERTSLHVLATDGTSYRAECLFSARAHGDGMRLHGLLSVPRSAPSDDPITSFSKLQDVLQPRLTAGGNISPMERETKEERRSVVFADQDDDADDLEVSATNAKAKRPVSGQPGSRSGQPEARYVIPRARDSAGSMKTPTPDYGVKSKMDPFRASVPGRPPSRLNGSLNGQTMPRASGPPATIYEDSSSGDKEDNKLQDMNQDERNFKRAKLSSKVKRLLATSTARLSFAALRRDALLGVALLLIAQFAVFFSILFLTQREAQDLQGLLKPPVILQSLQNIITDIRTGFASTPIGLVSFSDRLAPKGLLANATTAYYLIDNSTTSKTWPRLEKDINAFSLHAKDLYQGYVGNYGMYKAAYNVMSFGLVGATEYYVPQLGNASTGVYRAEILSTWDLCREVDRHSRVLAAYIRNSSLVLEVDSATYYTRNNVVDLLYNMLKDAVTSNGAVVVLKGGLTYANTSFKILIFELMVVIPFVLFYVCVKEIKVNDDDSDEDIDDDLEGLESSKVNGQKDAAEEQSSRVEIVKKDRQLKFSEKGSLYVVIGVFVLCYAVLVAFCTSLTISVHHANRPVLELEKAGKLFELITRIRMLSMRVMFSTDGFTLAQGRLLLREATETAQDIFTEATMSGKDGASFLDNPKYKKILLGHQCLRYDTTTCLPPSSSLYEATNSGLTAAWNKYIQSALQFSETPQEDLTIYDDAFQYLQEAGSYDVLDGVDRLLQYLYKDAVQHTNPIVIANGVVLAFFIIACIILCVACRPYLRQLDSECNRVAELLSLLPQGQVDVEGLVKASGVLPSDGTEEDEKRAPRDGSGEQDGGSNTKNKMWKVGKNKIAAMSMDDSAAAAATVLGSFHGFQPAPSRGPEPGGGATPILRPQGSGPVPSQYANLLLPQVDMSRQRNGRW